jgi:LL-diaminopimelate aminotransferase
MEFRRDQIRVARRLPSYPMAELPAIKRRLLAQGVDVIDLGAGDADFAPPRIAVETLAAAAADPAMSRYGFQLGLPAFREAAARYLQRRFGFTVDPFKELHPLIGSKEGIAHLAMAVLSPGDVAIVPEPGYAVYDGGTVLAGGEPFRYALTPRTDFLVELDEIPADVLRHTRLVYLNYPNNPTAAVADRAYLERVVAFTARHDILIAYDNPCCEYVRRVRGAQYSRDLRSKGRCRRVSFTLEKLLHDRMAARVRGGARGDHQRAPSREELRGHRNVSRRAGGRRRGARPG